MSVGLQSRLCSPKARHRKRFWPLHSQGRNCHDWLGDKRLSEVISCPCRENSPSPLGGYLELTDFASVSQLCLHATTLLETQIAHHHILKNGLEVHSTGVLIRNYNSFGAVRDSLSLFSASQAHSVAEWNSFITTFSCTKLLSEAFQMFSQMQLEGCLPDKTTFMQLVSVCATHADIAEGKRLHLRIRLSTFEIDVFLGTSIISMYDKCQSVSDAHRQWFEMPIRNEVSWTAIISCHVHHGQDKEAIQLFRDMLEQGVTPNKVTFVCILDTFATPRTLGGGQLLHHFIIESGYGPDRKLSVPLICMYKNCGSAADAIYVFETLNDRTLNSWNAAISVYQADPDLGKVLERFSQFQNEGFLANHITFLCLLGTLCSPEAIKDAKQIHVRVLHSGFESNIKVGTALINFYGRLGDMEAIDHLLAKIPKRDVFLWTSLIDLYCKQEHAQKAAQCFYLMQQGGIEPSRVTFVCILDAYRNSIELLEGRHMHAFITEKGYDADNLVGNTLLAFYGRFGCLHDALSVFNRLPERSVVSWTALMTICAEHGLSNNSLGLFNQMLLEGMQPTLVTFLSILDACTLEAAIEAGRLIHACAVEYGLESDDSLVTAIARMYSESGSLEDSDTLINGMVEDREFLWNAKISIHAQQGLYEHSLELFGQTESRGFQASVATYACVFDACASSAILEAGKLMHFSAICGGCEKNTVVENALLNMYGRCGDLMAAWRMFDGMAQKNVIAWSALIAMNGQHGLGQNALMLFECMESKGIIPNIVTYASVLEACNHSGLLFEALQCFMALVKDQVPFLVETYKPIIDLLGRTGCLDMAHFLINNMPCLPGALTLGVMLGACQCHADVDRAKHIANFALELDPDSGASYISLSNIFAFSTLTHPAAPTLSYENCR